VSERPRGTVTFLFTDVEGSTRLLAQLRHEYGPLLEQHQRLLRDAFAAHGGEEVDTQGDAFFYVFTRARDAVAAAADGQHALAEHPWPDGAAFRVRMGLHTGEPVLSDAGRYHGLGVHRTARIMAAGHGGQILLSQVTASLLADEDLEGLSLHDLGEHKLKDLERPEQIYELRVDGLSADHPALKSVGTARPPVYRRPLMVGTFAGVLAAAVAIPVFAFGGGSGPASLPRLSADSVGVVDPATGAIETEVTDVPAPTRVASGGNAIWVTSADGNSVSRIDAGTHQLRQTIAVGNGPSGVAYGAGQIWVANSLDGTVSRVDPVTNAVAGEPIRVGNNPAAVAYGDGSVWVTNVDDRSVSRIDPASGKVTTIAVGAAGRGIAVGDGAAWISDSPQNRLVRLDTATNEVTQTIGVGSGPSAVALTPGSVWVANTLDGTVSQVDAATNKVRATIPVGASPGALVTGAGAVWVANEAGRTLVRIDPRTHDVVSTVRTGARPTGLTLAGPLWVAAQASTDVHRGGHLTVESQANSPPPEKLDPASNYDYGWSLLGITNDGLVGFPRVGGSDGNQLVPDLATSLPTPTNGGKTYSFSLRRGIHFSTGAVLGPSDVLASVERVFRMQSPGLGYYAGIVGAAQCVKRPKRCDLSRGIVADDRAGTVTFHLTAPDAEFLYKLAIPFAYIVPRGTRAKSLLSVPATGPYMVAANDGRRAHLVRNPHFRVWSAIVKPDAYPDTIDVGFTTPVERAVTELEAGHNDLTNVLQSGAFLTNLETQHPAQVHTTPALATAYVFLDARTPPFDRIEARKAVAYALDRGALVATVGGSEAAQPACQVLPPNLTGYRPYCPYTLNSGPGGTWSAPDLARARALVRASGTSGMRVHFWFFASPSVQPKQREFFRKLFSSLGYRPSIRAFPDIESYYSTFLKTPSGRVQGGFQEWIADYPAPSNFFGIMTCASARDRAGNPGRFCSRSLDAEIRRALAQQSRDDALARALWTKIDRDATDGAAIIPVYTPRTVDLVSKRVGNYEHHPLWGVLLDQLWVR
jgi:YVTN family beta-propeller protein